MAQGKKTVYTPEQVQFVKDNCTMTAKGLHKAFCERFDRYDVSIYTLKALRLRNGWKTGRDGRMEQGHEAWNKGLIYIPKGIEDNLFKKGHVPWSTRDLGSERVNGDGYIEIKVPGNDKRGRWVLKHLYIWEQANGKKPDGHAIIFIDNDKQNVEIDNLMLVTRGELCIMNKTGTSRWTGQAKRTAQLIAQTKIRQREITKKK